MSAEPRPHDPAQARFFAIQAVRWTGLGMVLLALLALNGKLPIPEVAGYALLAVGLFDALFLPTFLARRWKSPKE